WGGPHHVRPAVLSLSQATEAGTVYRPHELLALADLAHARGLAVHMDGARLGNALARMNASLAEATWKAGVDALSFGATKAGALYYPWRTGSWRTSSNALPHAATLPCDASLVRLVTSFATTTEEVDRFVATAGSAR